MTNITSTLSFTSFILPFCYLLFVYYFYFYIIFLTFSFSHFLFLFDYIGYHYAECVSLLLPDMIRTEIVKVGWNSCYKHITTSSLSHIFIRFILY